MEKTDDVLYTLETTELFYAKRSLVTSIGDHIILFVLVGTILSSFMMRDHPFKHFPFLYIIFGSTSITYLFRIRRRRCVSSVKIAFYSDCIKIHRECVCARLNKAREEFHVFSYAPLPTITYNAKKHIITFEGNVHSESYRYVPRSIEKRLDKVVDHVGSCTFRLNNENFDIVSVIHQHSPVRVHVLEAENNI